MSRYKVYVCGPSDCPNDPAFEHDNYFGCIPKDFNGTKGTSKTHAQARGEDGLYQWNGGCVATREPVRGKTT